MKLAIVGAGWAGLSCAVEAVRAGHDVTVFEASRSLGGRARRVEAPGDGPALDNGQHILIGAYRETLAMMRTVGVDVDAALLRMPLSLRFADGTGFALPRWPEPLHLLAGIAMARGWSVHDKLTLLRTALKWRSARFRCSADATVAQLCDGLTSRTMRELIEPLCVSALNTPVEIASGQVFLRVLSDALFGEAGGADLLIPRVDMGQLFPDGACRWLGDHGARLHTGIRVSAMIAESSGWRIEGQPFDRVVLAINAPDAVRLTRKAADDCAEKDRRLAESLTTWAATAGTLLNQPIATVYVTGATPLHAPVMALHASADAPAQFAFDRGQLGGSPGSMALVASACILDRNKLENLVLRQAKEELKQPRLTVFKTIVEKRATFSCAAGIERPSPFIGRGLFACGDYVEGPYPSTLEGAVRSGVATAAIAGHRTSVV